MLESRKVETEKDILENEKIAFSYEKKAIKELELELAVRIEMMKKLGVYIDSKLAELQQQFINNKDYQDRYESDLGKKVDHIDNLTRLIEKRASRMEHLNYKLMEKNKQLKTDLKNTLIPDYRFAFSPYLGLRVNKDNQEIYDSREVGLRLLAFTGVHFHFASGIGLYNYIQRDASGKTTSGRSTTFAFDMGYLFNPMEKVGIYLSSGVSGDFYSSTLPTNVSAGLDFKYRTKPNMNAFLGVTVADSAMVRVGVETHLVSTKKMTAYKPHGSEKLENEFENDTKENAFVALNEIPRRYMFFNKPILFTDIKKSWYMNSVNNINQIGVYSSNEFGNLFEPNASLDIETASTLLSWMYDIENLLLVDPIDISFSIFSDLNETVLASVYIKDEDGKTVEILCDKQKFYVGEQVLKWDPSKSDKQLSPGGYYVYLDIYSNEVQRDRKEYSLESALISSVVKSFEIAGISSYKDFVKIKSGVQTKSFTNKAVQNNWIELGKKRNDSIKRIDFIVAVSKLLVESGALYRPINVDFTPYKDWSLVPINKKRYLTTYVLELGYGGDSLSKLNPNDVITNAQAAVILDRFFNWKKQKIEDSNRYFNVKTIASNP